MGSRRRLDPRTKQYFCFYPGLARVCQNLESLVASNLSLPLTARLTLSELEAHLTQVDNYYWSGIGVKY